MNTKETTKTKTIRAYCVRDQQTNRLIQWCYTRAATEQALVRWERHCQRRNVPNTATIEEIEQGQI
jgi:hypothetical protein